MKPFTKNNKPQNVGKGDSQLTYTLSYQVGEYMAEVAIDEILVIGSSEQANLRLTNNDIAPIHCKIFNNNSILSVIHCNSSFTTRLNSLELETNKQYIIDINDSLVVGSFKITFNEVKSNKVIHMDMPSIDDEVIESSKINISKGIQKSKPQLDSKNSLNSFFRTVAVIVDILIVMIVLNLTDFLFSSEMLITPFVDSVNEMINSMTGLGQVLDAQLEKLPVLRSFTQDLESVISINTTVISKYFYLVTISRMIFSLIFGVSAAQFLIGTKACANSFGYKLKSALRCLLDAIFVPLFVVTKFSTLFSKPSLEEIISRTTIRSRSFVLSLVLSCLMPCLLLLLFMALPLIYNPSGVMDKKVSHIKITRVDQDKKSQTNIDYLNLKFFSDKNTIILPQVKLKRVKGKATLYPEINVIYSDSSLKIKKLKQVSTSNLFGPLFKDMVFFKQWYPEISSSFSEYKSSAIKMDKLRYEPFSVELTKMLSASYSMKSQSPLEYIQVNGPILSPYFEFQKIIGSLVQVPFEEIKVFSRQNGVFVFFQEKVGTKLYLNLLSINKELTTLYDLQLDNMEVNDLAAGLDIVKATNSQDGLSLFFQALNSDDSNLKLLAFQETYELLYDSARSCFNNDNLNEVLVNTKNLFDYFKTQDNDQSQARMKFIQNLGDLIEAIDSRDRSFFNLEVLL